MKSYLRFLSRNKLYTAIEVVGLSIALAFVIPLVNILVNKNECCHAHDRYDDIYAVSYRGNLWTDVGFGSFIKERIPEVERVSEAIINKRTIIDDDFFYFFPFEFIEGDESFLESWKNIAISDKYASIITDGSAIGKEIKIDGEYHTVAAVFKSGRNDILKECDILQNIAPFTELPQAGGTASVVTFVSLKEGHDRKEAENKILSAADEFKQGDSHYLKAKEFGVDQGLVRYDEIPGSLMNYDQFMKFRIMQMSFLASLICLIFIVAILNYINLNIAVSTTRAKENATRRLVGATRSSLIIKGLIESVLFTSICFIFGIILSHWSSSFIRSLLVITEFSDFTVNTTWNLKSIMFFILLIIATSFIAGLVPALISSKFNPLDVTKGSFRLHKKRFLSKFFISIQTILSVILISAVMMLNTYYRKAMDVEYNCAIEDVAFMKTPHEYAETIISKAASYPEILSAGFASQVPASGLSGVMSIPEGNNYLFSHIECDPDGFETFGFDIMEQYNDDTKGLWLTPLTISDIEKDTLLLNMIFKTTGTSHVAGIINDFPGSSPLESTGESLTFVSVKDNTIKPGVVFKTTGDHEKCRKIIKELHNEACKIETIEGQLPETEPKYVREILTDNMASSKFIIDIMGIVMILVVVMSMMGLTGMSIHYTNEHKNDIAVRKIFGATEKKELMRNLRFYIIITSIGSVMAICFTELIRSVFADMGITPENVWWVYVAATAISFAISLSAVLWQTIRAARTNPAEALKKE